MLRLDPTLAPEAFTSVFRRFGRLHVPGLLVADDALRLRASVAGATGWRRVIHMGTGEDVDIPMSEYEALAPEERARLEADVHAAARDSFRYMFDSVRIAQDRLAGREVDPALARADAFLNSEAFLSFVRRLT
ncbi:MAG TPA: hypothetical protein VGB49_04995, partial [Caulobacteraceae bacterium]